ncbi:MAG: hypothetical protein GX978_07785 [Tissierellia bacterium]|jgi:hypothetical protein|nr:hypothetical protein [Tissierellia bacterium]
MSTTERGTNTLDRKIWKTVTKGIDIEKIRNVPVAEKFIIVEYLKHMRGEADWAIEHGQENINQSPNYIMGNSYRLMAAMIARQYPVEDMQAVSWNYLDNFKYSETYYTKFSIVALGTLMIRMGVPGDTIFHMLLGTLGDDFLTKNLKYYGYVQALETEAKFATAIKYKDYELKYRKMKYDLMALNLMNQEDGIDAVENYIINHSKDDDLKLFFQLIKRTDPAFRKWQVLQLIQDEKDYNQMVITGIMSIFLERDLMLSHYMMNSAIGKYSNFDRRPEKVEAEVRARYEAMKAML